MTGKKVAILALILAAIGSVFWLSCCPGGKPERIVFVTIDTLRADHLTSYGYIRPSSPFVDGLAKDGVVFEKAFSACSHTAPSHSSYFTSLYPFQHQVVKNHDVLSPDIFHVAKLAQANDYEVMGFSSVRFMDDKVGFPRVPESEDIKDAIIPEGAWFRNAKVQVDRVAHWLKNIRKKDKFFIWVHLYDVHQWAGLGRLPQSYRQEAHRTGSKELVTFINEEHKIPTEFFKSDRELLKAINGYDARLKFADDELRRLQGIFEAEGLGDDLLWIIGADHGEGLGNHNYHGHGQFIYNEQLHIPLIFSYSDKRHAGMRIPNMVRTVDFLPTVADILQAPLPKKVSPALQGRSLLPLIETGSIPENEMSHMGFAQRRPKDETKKRIVWEDGEIESIFSGKRKYIQHSTGKPEFYDLEKDPFELENLAELEDGEVKAKKEAYHEELNHLLKNSERLPEGSGTVEKTPEEIEELKSLGYL